QRPHVRNSRAHGNALFTIEVPENSWVTGIMKPLDAEGGNPLLDFWVLLSGMGDARKVPLDVSHENRNADTAQMLRNDPQGDGLSCPGGTGNKTVPVGHSRE